MEMDKRVVVFVEVSKLWTQLPLFGCCCGFFRFVSCLRRKGILVSGLAVELVVVVNDTTPLPSSVVVQNDIDASCSYTLFAAYSGGVSGSCCICCVRRLVELLLLLEFGVEKNLAALIPHLEKFLVVASGTWQSRSWTVDASVFSMMKSDKCGFDVLFGTLELSSFKTLFSQHFVCMNNL